MTDLLEKLRKLQQQIEQNKDSDYEVIPRQKLPRKSSPNKKKIVQSKQTKQNIAPTKQRKKSPSKVVTQTKNKKPKTEINSSPKKRILAKEPVRRNISLKKAPVQKKEHTDDISSRFNLFIKEKSVKIIIMKLFFKRWASKIQAKPMKTKKYSRIPTRNPSVKKATDQKNQQQQGNEKKIQELAQRYEGLNQYKKTTTKVPTSPVMKSRFSPKASSPKSPQKMLSPKANSPKASPKRKGKKAPLKKDKQTEAVIPLDSSSDDEDLIKFTAELLKNSRAKHPIKNPWEGFDGEEEDENENEQENKHTDDAKALINKAINKIEDKSDKESDSDDDMNNSITFMNAKRKTKQQKLKNVVQEATARKPVVAAPKYEVKTDSDDEITSLVNDVKALTKRISPKSKKVNSPVDDVKVTNKKKGKESPKNDPMKLILEDSDSEYEALIHGKRKSPEQSARTELRIDSTITEQQPTKHVDISSDSENYTAITNAKIVQAEISSNDSEDDTVDLSLRNVLENARKRQGTTMIAQSAFDDENSEEMTRYIEEQKRKNITETTIQLSPAKKNPESDDSSDDIERLIAQSKKEASKKSSSLMDSDEDFASFLKTEKIIQEQEEGDDTEEIIIKTPVKANKEQSDEDFTYTKFQPKPQQKEEDSEDEFKEFTKSSQQTKTTNYDDDSDEDFLAFLRGKPQQVQTPTKKAEQEKTVLSPQKLNDNDDEEEEFHPLEQLNKEIAIFSDSSDDDFVETIRNEQTKPRQETGGKKQAINISNASNDDSDIAFAEFKPKQTKEIALTMRKEPTIIPTNEVDSDEEFIKLIREENTKQKEKAAKTKANSKSLSKDSALNDSFDSGEEMKQSKINIQKQEENSELNDEDIELIASITGSRGKMQTPKKDIVKDESNDDLVKESSENLSPIQKQQTKVSKQAPKTYSFDSSSDSDDLNELLKPKQYQFQQTKSPKKENTSKLATFSTFDGFASPTKNTDDISNEEEEILNEEGTKQVIANKIIEEEEEEEVKENQKEEKQNKASYLFDDDSDDDIEDFIKNTSKWSRTAFSSSDDDKEKEAKPVLKQVSDDGAEEGDKYRINPIKDIKKEIIEEEEEEDKVDNVLIRSGKIINASSDDEMLNNMTIDDFCEEEEEQKQTTKQEQKEPNTIKESEHSIHESQTEEEEQPEKEAKIDAKEQNNAKTIDLNNALDKEKDETSDSFDLLDISDDEEQNQQTEQNSKVKTAAILDFSDSYSDDEIQKQDQTKDESIPDKQTINIEKSTTTKQEQKEDDELNQTYEEEEEEAVKEPKIEEKTEQKDLLKSDSDYEEDEEISQSQQGQQKTFVISNVNNENAIEEEEENEAEVSMPKPVIKEQINKDDDEEDDEISPEKVVQLCPPSPITLINSQTSKRDKLTTPPSSPLKGVSFEGKLEPSPIKERRKDLNLSENVSKLLEEMDSEEEEEGESAENFINRIYATTLKGSSIPTVEDIEEEDNFDNEEIMKSLNSPKKSILSSIDDTDDKLEILKKQIASFQDMEEDEEEDDSFELVDTDKKIKEFMDLKITDSDEEEEEI